MDNTAVERAEDSLLSSMAKSTGDKSRKSDNLLNQGGTSTKLGSSVQSAATFIENESRQSCLKTADDHPKEGDVQVSAVPVPSPKIIVTADNGAFEDVERDLLIQQGDSAAAARGYQASRDFLEKELSKQAGVGESGKDLKGAHKTDESRGKFDEDITLGEGSSESGNKGKLGGLSDEVGKTVGNEKECNVSGASSEEVKCKMNVSDGTVKESLGDNASNETSEKDQNSKDDDEWEDILGSGQIKKKVIKKAENGHRPGQNSICKINLIGRLEDGSEVERYENLEIDLGDVEVIQGIDLALPLMEVGEVALVEIGPRFAYGVLGKEPEIPSNARMFYSVELLSAEDTPELEALPISKRKAIGIRKRERGNWWFSRQEYNFAIHCYRRAIEYLDDVTEGFSSDNREEGQNIDDELQDLLENRLKVYNNLAAAQLKIKVYEAALTSVENVLRCQPQNVKALFRKGKILSAKGDTASAVSVLTAAKKLEPDNSVIKQELLRCMSLLKEDTNQEKNLYKKMLGQDKPQLENVAKGQSKVGEPHLYSPRPSLSESRGITWGLVCGSLVAVFVGALAFRYKFP